MQWCRPARRPLPVLDARGRSPRSDCVTARCRSWSFGSRSSLVARLREKGPLAECGSWGRSLGEEKTRSRTSGPAVNSDSVRAHPSYQDEGSRFHQLPACGYEHVRHGAAFPRFPLQTVRIVRSWGPGNRKTRNFVRVLRASPARRQVPRCGRSRGFLAASAQSPHGRDRSCHR